MQQHYLINKGIAKDDTDLQNFNRRIIELADEVRLPVCATCDAHFLNKEDEISRKILLIQKITSRSQKLMK
jgi:DNA polymerase-3 subunit alpha (Gram-positive type)